MKPVELADLQQALDRALQLSREGEQIGHRLCFVRRQRAAVRVTNGDAVVGAGEARERHAIHRDRHVDRHGLRRHDGPDRSRLRYGFGAARHAEIERDRRVVRVRARDGLMRDHMEHRVVEVPRAVDGDVGMVGVQARRDKCAVEGE